VPWMGEPLWWQTNLPEATTLHTSSLIELET
jgi:hypothetical protein